MECITINVTTKQVGNSLAVFIPANVKEELGLKPQDEVTIEIHKTKNPKSLLSAFGSLKGKGITWACKEDRYDKERDD